MTDDQIIRMICLEQRIHGLDIAMSLVEDEDLDLLRERHETLKKEYDELRELGSHVDVRD